MTVNTCGGCQKTDDDPKHGTTALPGQPLPLPWHMDCHTLLAGCQVCTTQLTLCNTHAGPDGVKGNQLRARLIALRNKPNNPGA